MQGWTTNWFKHTDLIHTLFTRWFIIFSFLLHLSLLCLKIFSNNLLSLFFLVQHVDLGYIELKHVLKFKSINKIISITYSPYIFLVDLFSESSMILNKGELIFQGFKDRVYFCYLHWLDYYWNIGITKQNILIFFTVIHLYVEICQKKCQHNFLMWSKCHKANQ